MATVRLDMVFKKADGRNSRVSVDNAREDVTALEVSTFMDNLITKGVFEPNASAFVEKVSAEIVSIETSELTLV
ncbi:MAG: DUF2922 domain-containing protein [Eubacteriaceae bacterium]|nr:DUF2922 domain-containing protein [Eubacteriaceae bacterium]